MTFDRRAVLQTLAAGAAVGLTAGAAKAAADDLYVIAEIVAKPEAADAFRKTLTDFVAGARKEPGCKHYVLLEDPAKPGHFFTFETWADKAALEAHLNSPAMKAAGPALAQALATPLVITPLTLLSDS